MKNRKTTAFLALFLGGLGVHKFYLGKYVQGILCLLFSWTYIPIIIGVIEFFIYIIMSDYNFDLYYNTKYGNVEPEEPKMEVVTLYDPTTTKPVPFKEALRRVHLASTNQSRERQKRMVIEMDKIVKSHRCSIHNKPVKYGYSFKENKMWIDIIAKCCEKSDEELTRKLNQK